MKRPGQPVEMAPLYVLLASRESSYVTGEVFGATGVVGGHGLTPGVTTMPLLMGRRCTTDLGLRYNSLVSCDRHALGTGRWSCRLRRCRQPTR